MAPSSSTLKVASILGVTLLMFLLDWLYLNYMDSKGLALNTQTLSVGSNNILIPLQWLPVFGVVLVSFVTWYEAYYRIFPRRGIEIDPLARLRLLRAAVFSLALFVLVLYVPALIGSSWFLNSLSNAGRSVSQMRDFGNSLVNNIRSFMGLDLVWQYSISQTLAPFIMVLSIWGLGRSTRRPRK